MHVSDITVYELYFFFFEKKRRNENSNKNLIFMKYFPNKHLTADNAMCILRRVHTSLAGMS